VALAEIEREMGRVKTNAKDLQQFQQNVMGATGGNPMVSAQVARVLGGAQEGTLDREGRLAAANAYAAAQGVEITDSQLAIKVAQQVGRTVGLLPDAERAAFGGTMGSVAQLAGAAGMKDMSQEDQADLAYVLRRRGMSTGPAMGAMMQLVTAGVPLDEALKLASAAERTNQSSETLNAVASFMMEPGDIGGPDGRFYATDVGSEERLKMLLAGEGPLEREQAGKLQTIMGGYSDESMLAGVLETDVLGIARDEAMKTPLGAQAVADAQQRVRSENVDLRRSPGDRYEDYFRKELEVETRDMGNTRRYIANRAFDFYQFFGQSPDEALASSIGTVGGVAGETQAETTARFREMAEGGGFSAGYGEKMLSALERNNRLLEMIAKGVPTGRAIELIEKNTRGPVLGSAGAN
jgi:hypothetical protein